MRRFLILFVTLLASFALAAPPAVAGVVDLPVSFAVQNRNTSQVQCTSDGFRYTVAGRLVAPSSALSNHPIPAATVYIHGSGGSALWHFQAVPGYDYAAQLAGTGHVSVVLDLLGYGQSGLPEGHETCFGSDADVVSQVIAQLKAGTYDAGNRQEQPIQRIALAGHSGGGERAQIEAYSFRDIDALLVVGWADQESAASLPAGPLVTRFETRCAGGGQPKYDDRPSPGGYAFIFDFPQDAPVVWHDGDPQVIAAYAPLYERDPCTYIDVSSGQGQLVDQALVPTINVPVLLVYGDHDLYSPQDGAEQRDRYAGSADKSLAIIPNAGHFVQLERNAAVFRKVMSDWLSARGF
jgi:pimeloyl-ACP methyl ester carboxylesterase